MEYNNGVIGCRQKRRNPTRLREISSRCSTGRLRTAGCGSVVEPGHGGADRTHHDPEFEGVVGDEVHLGNLKATYRETIVVKSHVLFDRAACSLRSRVFCLGTDEVVAQEL